MPRTLTRRSWPNARLWCALDLLLTCETISEARDRAYAAVPQLRWPGVQYRRDVAAGAALAVGAP